MYYLKTYAVQVPAPAIETFLVLQKDTARRVQTELLELTTVFTLGVSEAVLLLDEMGGSSQRVVSNLDDLVCLAKALHNLGPEYVLLKGDRLSMTGNLEAPECGFDKGGIINILYDGIDISIFNTAHVASGAPQGAGCAIACISSIPEPSIFAAGNRL